MKKKITLNIPQHSKQALAISFGITGILFSISLFIILFGQPEIPLFYSLANPRDQLVNKELILILPLISLIINFINTFLITRMNDGEKIIQSLFAWSTAIIQVVLLIACVRIVLITLSLEF